MAELFSNEPVEICDKEVGIFLYNKEDIHGFKLSLYMSIYENVSSINLHKDLTKAINVIIAITYEKQ